MITVIDSDAREHSLQGLLDLDRETIEVGQGFWIAMRAKRVPQDEQRPHGIQYALTLHRPGGDRVLGYDNAHAPKMRPNPSVVGLKFHSLLELSWERNFKPLNHTEFHYIC